MGAGSVEQIAVGKCKDNSFAVDDESVKKAASEGWLGEVEENSLFEEFVAMLQQI